MLISKKQYQANQANAKKSTGPKTPEGKKVSRLNAVTTMLYTKETVVYAAGETDAMWESHRQRLVDDLEPQDSVQMVIVEDMASISFRMARLRRMEAGHLDTRANALYNATITRDKDCTPINPHYDGWPTAIPEGNAKLMGDTAAQVTTCTKLLPEIWRQEVRLRTAWEKNLKLLKQLQAEQAAAEEEIEPQEVETKQDDFEQPLTPKPPQTQINTGKGEAEPKPSVPTPIK
ncbi:MAG: hypothetical protein JST16_05665 [Bdellovibrionales bacterium]|nr:hypothetical protein [Bdellovibrionales bacterium]